MSTPPELSPQAPVPDSEQLELKLPDESASPKELGLWAGVLVLLTLIAYWPATTGSFVWRDDHLAQQKWLLAPGGLSLAWFDRWQHPEDYSVNSPVYQPMALTAYWMEYRAGGKTDKNLPAPMVYHVASLIFHAGAAVLLWLLLRELMLPGAWIISAIFALHPIHSEPVSWISEQATPLAGLFFIGSLYCYWMFVKWRERDATEKSAGREGVDPAQTWGLYSAAASLFLLAILSDPSAVVLPAVLLLVLWWKKKLTSQDGALITPMIIAAVALWISTMDMHGDPGEAILLHAPLLTKAIMLGDGMWFTLFRLIVPMHFSVMDFSIHQVSGVTAAGSIAVAVMILLSIVVLIPVAVNRPQRRRGPLVAIAVFFLLVCSSLNWFDSTRLTPVTDCVAYLAIVPVLILLVALITTVKLPGPHPQTAVVVCAIVLIGLGLLAWMRTYAFESSVALWRDVVQKDPDAPFAQGALAEQLRMAANEDFASGNVDPVKGERAQAKEHALQASRLDPHYALAQRIWANVLSDEGDVAGALPHYQAALELEPNNSALRIEYGQALDLLGRFDAAIPILDEALIENPNSSKAHSLLGEAYQGIGRFDRAMLEQNLALMKDPSNIYARQKLAELEARGSKPEDLKSAVTDYFKILADKTQQSRPDLWLAVADIVRRQGDFEHALKFLQTARSCVAPEDAEMLKKVDAQIERVTRMAATRPSTLPSTPPTESQPDIPPAAPRLGP
jgi:Tfp pilus assembly protein PilF